MVPLLTSVAGFCASAGCCVDAIAWIDVEGTLESSAGEPVSGASVQVEFNESGGQPNEFLPVMTNARGEFTAPLGYDMYGGCAPFPLSLLLPGSPPAPPQFDALLLIINQRDVEITVSVPVAQDMVVRTTTGASVSLGTIVVENGESESN
jgi:hypothetical protein